MLDQAIVLAGGFGQRLGALTASLPKPLQPVGGRPFVDHLVWNLHRFGIRRVVFSIGHLAERIIEHIGDGSRLGIAAEHVIEQQPLGTAGAIRGCFARLDERALVLNGDTLFDFNYLDLAVLQRRTGADIALALTVPHEDASRFGLVELDDQGVVRGFAEKRQSQGMPINAGAYVISRDVVDAIPDGPVSLERQVLPSLVREGRVAGAIYRGFFIDIGVPESLARANEEVPRWRHKRAAFLDRDGVINVDRGYVHRPDDFTFVEGAPEAIRWLNDQGILVLVVTNQAGIARGHYDEHTFLDFSAWIQSELRDRGAHIDATYFCPHHPTAGLGEYRTHCDCRKPAPGLFERAIREWDVDVAGSVAIGDTESDVEAAKRAGVRGMLFTGGNLLEDVKRGFDRSCAGSRSAG